MKIYIFMVIVVGLQMLLYLAGMTLTSGYVLLYLDPVNNPQNFQTSVFFAKILAIFSVAITGSVILGYVTGFKPESILVGSFALGVLSLFVFDMIGIISYYRGAFDEFKWMGVIINLFLFPIAVGYTISLVSWWRGITT